MFDGKFHPQGPASPYITTVGGTRRSSPEEAMGLSSGGFSDYWPSPEWQRDAVTAYLSSGAGLPNVTERGVNTSGRAYPDIAAQADNFCVVADTSTCTVSGTSCASPTAAGIFALLNDLRLQKGKATLGFLNPFIYENADAFTDITNGASRGCQSGKDGWPATAGWDAVTGVGTPNYQKLAAAVAQLH